MAAKSGAVEAPLESDAAFAEPLIFSLGRFRTIAF